MCCSVLQVHIVGVIVVRTILQRVAECWSVLACVGSALKSVAVCCSVLQCVAVRRK